VRDDPYSSGHLWTESCTICDLAWTRASCRPRGDPVRRRCLHPRAVPRPRV